MVRLRSHSVRRYLSAMDNLGGSRREIPKAQWDELTDVYSTGTVERIEVQPGLELLLTRYQLRRELDLLVEVDRPIFSFGCVVEGSMRIEGISRDLHLRDGDSVNMWASDGAYSFRAQSGIYHSVCLEASSAFLRANVMDVNLPSSRILEAALFRSNFPSFLRAQPMSSVSRLAATALLASSGDDPLRSLLLESHALTILREQLLRVLPGSENGRRNPSSEKNRIDQLEEVRRLLINSPEMSPSLFDLARQVGMNECTLKRGFRARFGMTVYEYLRNHRMKIAEAMLRSGDRNVSETAAAVGYRSPGRFAIAFRREFGVPPKEHQISLRDAYSRD